MASHPPSIADVDRDIKQQARALSTWKQYAALVDAIFTRVADVPLHPLVADIETSIETAIADLAHFTISRRAPDSEVTTHVRESVKQTARLRPAVDPQCTS